MIADVVNLIMRSSLMRLKAHSRKPNIKLEQEISAKLVYGHWMALNLVYGSSLRITFKVHFMTATARFFASGAYQADPKVLTLQQSTDFFKEFCNLVSGQVRQNLEKDDVKTGASLPILTRGFDEVFFPKTKSHLASNDQWGLRCEDHLVICSARVEIFKEVDLSYVRSSGAEMDDSGDIEFF